MPSSGARFSEVGIDRWITGLDRLDFPDSDDLVLWKQATEVFFDRTQAAVHVISGALKQSGQLSMGREARSRIYGEVKYGGTAEVDYAVYEFRRGGSHDALGRGFEQTNKVFSATLAKILEAKVGRWA